MIDNLHFIFLGLIIITVILVALVAYLRFRPSDSKNSDKN